MRILTFRTRLGRMSQCLSGHRLRRAHLRTHGTRTETNGRPSAFELLESRAMRASVSSIGTFAFADGHNDGGHRLNVMHFAPVHSESRVSSLHVFSELDPASSISRQLQDVPRSGRLDSLAVDRTHGLVGTLIVMNRFAPLFFPTQSFIGNHRIPTNLPPRFPQAAAASVVDIGPTSLTRNFFQQERVPSADASRREVSAGQSPAQLRSSHISSTPSPGVSTSTSTSSTGSTSSVNSSLTTGRNVLNSPPTRTTDTAIAGNSASILEASIASFVDQEGNSLEAVRTSSLESSLNQVPGPFSLFLAEFQGASLPDDLSLDSLLTSRDNSESSRPHGMHASRVDDLLSSRDPAFWLAETIGVNDRRTDVGKPADAGTTSSTGLDRAPVGASGQPHNEMVWLALRQTPDHYGGDAWLNVPEFGELTPSVNDDLMLGSYPIIDCGVDGCTTMGRGTSAAESEVDQVPAEFTSARLPKSSSQDSKIPQQGSMKTAGFVLTAIVLSAGLRGRKAAPLRNAIVGRWVEMRVYLRRLMNWAR